jgi:hypothetical protein
MIFRYNIFELFEFYNSNKNIINAYLKGESIEGFQDTTTTLKPIDSSKLKEDLASIFLYPFAWIFAISLQEALFVFVIFFIFSLICFIISLILLIKNWNRIPTWAKVLGIVLLFSPLPILTTIIVSVS